MKKENIEALVIALVTVVVAISLFNVYSIGTLTSGISASTDKISGASVSMIPTGTPKIYGSELDIKYDDVSPSNQIKADETINKLAQLDISIELNGQDKERYINILYNMNDGMSCEYCCGARSIIFETGEAACGCAHSFAMRGLTKYLITEHGDEYSDEEILSEIGKWKTLFFPGQMSIKAEILKSEGIELNYITLASNQYRGIEQGAKGSGMVGGC